MTKSRLRVLGLPYANAVRFTLLIALGSMLAACEAAIDTSTMDSFEKTLAQVKRSVSANERTKLENAIFAIAERKLSATFFDYGYPRDYESALDHAMSLRPGIFAADFEREWQDLKQGQEARSEIIIVRAESANLDIADPVAPIVKNLVTDREKGLRDIIARADEVVSVSNIGGLGSCSFEFENDTKWPITRLDVEASDSIGGAGHYGSHKFDPPLPPGQRESLRLEDSSCVLLSATHVEVTGHAGFTPLEKSQWLSAKSQFEHLEKVKADVSAGLLKALAWLRAVN